MKFRYGQLHAARWRHFCDESRSREGTRPRANIVRTCPCCCREKEFFGAVGL